MLWHAPAKIKRGGHFGVLTGMPVFKNITLHRATNSAQSQDKIRLVFHFVERNKIAYLFLYVPQIIARQNIACIYKHLLYQQFLIRMSTVNICLTFSASQRPITAFTEWLVSQSSNNITVQSVCIIYDVTAVIWCPETMKRPPCWGPKSILRELNSFVSFNKYARWSRECIPST